MEAVQVLGILLAWLIFLTVVNPVVGYQIGKALKGRPSGGAVMGCLLGPIGWLLVALGPDYRHLTECPRCRAPLIGKSAYCRECRMNFMGRPRTSPKHTAATVSDNGDLICSKCGEQGIDFNEMGETITKCPSCGLTLGTR